MDFTFTRNQNLNVLKFEIPGLPASKQSVQVGVATDKTGAPVFETSKSGKRRAKTIKFTPKKQRADATFLKWAFTLQRPAAPFELWKGPIEVVRLHFIFPWTGDSLRQKKKTGADIIYKASKPDLVDNLNKALFDAMRGIVFVDDAQIVAVNDLKKYYGDPPGTILVIKKMEG